MEFDPQRLLSSPPIETTHTITTRDSILYALGVGAEDLEFVFEEKLKALPTMAVVLAYPGFFWRDPKYGADWKKILHAEQQLELHAPLPSAGTFRGETRFEAVHDKGADKGALVYSARKIFNQNNQHIATVRSGTFLRGNGGCGSTAESPPKPPALPDREPDIVIDYRTADNQALIYRLSGDLNPLHVDPDVAESAGFKKPILHGLCTYGMVGRAVLAGVADNEPTRLRKFNVRFSAPVYPGESIRTEIWHMGGGQVVFCARAMERDVVIVSNGLGVIE